MNISLPRSLCCILGLWMAALPLAAQLRLDDCVAKAEANYPLVCRLSLIDQTEGLSLDRIQTGWLPQITASAQATLQSDVAQWPAHLSALLTAAGGTPPKGVARDQYKIALQADQLLYDGGRSAAAKAVTKAETAVGKAEVAVQLYALRRRVHDLYFSILLVDGQRDNNAILRQLLADHRRQLAAHVDKGLAPTSALAPLDAELLTAEQADLTLRSQRRELVTLLALFLHTDLPADIALAMPEIPLPNAPSQRPEFSLFAAQARRIEAQEQQLRRRLRPTLGAFVQSWYGYPGLNLFDDMTSRRFSLNAIVGLRATWSIAPLYTRRSDRAQLATAREEVAVARQLFEFNLRQQAAGETERSSHLRQLLRSDEQLIALRQQVREATGQQLLRGTVDAHRLVEDLAREHQARIAAQLHRIQLLQTLHQLHLTDYE